jgi:L-aspartate oxidase
MHALFDERRYLIPFRATLLPQIFTDVLVIGEGVAGLRAALAAAEHSDVIVCSKRTIKHSATYWAQGGIAVVMDTAHGDSLDQHVRDTLIAGADLCDEPIVREVIEQGPPRIRELLDWGMPCDRVARPINDDDAGGEPPLALGKEGGHSHFRIVHADGDQTGKALALTLHARVRAHDKIRLFEECFVLDLVTVSGTQDSGGKCVGAITHHPKYGLQMIWAHATILASGGAGQVYRESTNPNVATGDGLAMAYRAGAALADMAFMQFHPTTLYIAGANRSLITEAVRGEGAHLIDRSGYRFMGDYDERLELAPRDIVARAILAQMAKTNHTHVYLDCRHIGAARFSERFPAIFELLRKFDIDPGTTPVPIQPAAHYMIGGVLTDAVGRTNLAGLYACGEVSCTGLHGANRLASNSLLEGLVLGEITGRICREMHDPTAGNARAPIKVISDIRPSERSELDLADVRSSLRSVMWRHVGIERIGRRLEEVAEMFDFWARYTLDKIFDDRTGWETQNLLTVGALITRAALWRQESRGTHYRLDHPQASDAMRSHDVWIKGESNPTQRPVVDAQPAAAG